MCEWMYVCVSGCMRVCVCEWMHVCVSGDEYKWRCSGNAVPSSQVSRSWKALSEDCVLWSAICHKTLGCELDVE